MTITTEPCQECGGAGGQCCTHLELETLERMEAAGEWPTEYDPIGVATLGETL